MSLKDIHSVYFIGIGGIGMSALARYFHWLGKFVAGYDKTQTPLIDELMALGMDIHFKDAVDSIPNQFKDKRNVLVVYTPAVPKSHAELQFFQENGHVIKKRSEVLGLITKDTFCLAVAGTHGKTTTSSILAHLLSESGMSMTAFLGGVSEDFNSNFVFKGNEISVVEADEFDRSFLHLSPNVACITSMDADHLDIYGSHDELVRTFEAFTGCLKPDGKLIVRKGLPISGITYGIEDGADYCIENVKLLNGTYHFDMVTPKGVFKAVQFTKPGAHNLLNALAAFAMGVEANGPANALAKALASFTGVQRRFSYQIKKDDFVFIDDYAHHPTEIDAIHQAIREAHPNRKVTVVFQPHLYSRTKDFADDFAISLSRFDVVFLLEIYPAREEPIKGVDASWLLEKIANPNKELIAKSHLVDRLKKCKTEVLVTLGAGDIGLEVPKLKKALAYAD